VWLSLRVVPWIAPIGMLVVFVLTFFPWVALEGIRVSANAWRIGFSGQSDPIIGVYLIFVLLALFLSIPSGLFALHLAPTPPPVEKLGVWRPVIVGGVALVGCLFLVIKYLDAIFSYGMTPGTIWLKLAFRIHLLVVLSSALEYWLEVRKRRNLPSPRIEMHW
jgi:hypothetical protein